MAQLSEPTLARLLKETRVFLNQPRAENSFWKDDELIGYINDGIRQYFLIVQENAEGEFDAATTLDLVSGVDTVTLPDDCFEVKALYSVQNNINVVLHYYNNLTSSYPTGPASTDGNVYTPYYYFRGNDLVLRPVPAGDKVGGLFLEYTRFPETLITGGDTLTRGISPVFKEIVVKYAVYQAKIKESLVQGGDTYRAIEGHLAGIVESFKRSVAGRSKYPQFVKPFSPE